MICAVSISGKVLTDYNLEIFLQRGFRDEMNVQCNSLLGQFMVYRT